MDSKPENSVSNDITCKDTEVRVKEEDAKSSQKHESPTLCKEEHELECAKEENERLKKSLERVENDYRTLQMRFFDVFQHEPPLDKSPTYETQKEDKAREEEVSLHLGLQTPTRPNQNGNTMSSSKSKVNEELSLGLDLKSPSRIELSDTGSDKSEDAKDDAVGETWPPNKVSKSTKNGRKDEELSEQNTAKRARVCVRARCDTPTMNDGCQWRKYGQKISKGNPCPRAYYRCTVAPSCPVRKQVQRCSEDMSILITSYEGTHNHALPAAATAMASTTSAAASILLSGSSTSEHNASTSANLNGLNFTLYNTSRTGQFNLPNSYSPAPPTITLDLTSPQSSHFNRKLSTSFLPSSSSSSKYASRSLDFSTSEPSTFPTAWNSNYTSPFSFGKPTPQVHQIHYPSSASTSTSTSQQFLTETLTKVLTSDPSFQSAVAAAISSMVGTNSTHPGMSQASVSPMHGISMNPQAQNGIVYRPPYLNKLPSTSSSSGSQGFMLLQPQFPYTTLSKSSSASDLRDQLK